MTPLLVAFLLASNGSGKTLVRTNPGTTVPISGSARPVISEDANTVSHVYWNGAILKDTKSNAWTMTGTVPQVAKSPPTPAGAGPFTTSNYYKLSTDAINFTGDFWACGVFYLASNATGTGRLIGANNSANSIGWTTYFTVGAQISVQWNGADTPVAIVPKLGSVNMACWGRTGTTSYLKANLAAIRAATITAGVATGTATYLGVYSSGAIGQPMGGTFLEFIASSTSPGNTTAADALFTATMNRVKAAMGVSAW